MTKDQLAERYVARLKRCLTAVKILIGFSVAAIAALVIFVAVSGGIAMNESNPAAMLLGIIILVIVAVLTVAGKLTTLLIANITVKKLKKLGDAGE